MRLALALVLATGCDHVFGLDGHASDAADPLAGCPDSYVEVPGSANRYRYVDVGLDWLQAEANCEDHTQGRFTHLAEFDSLDDMEMARALVMQNPPWIIWVGYARDTGGDPAVFYGVTGDQITTTSPLWQAGEPNNVNNTEMVTTLASWRHMNDDGKGYPLASLCECDGKPAVKHFSF